MITMLNCGDFGEHEADMPASEATDLDDTNVEG